MTEKTASKNRTITCPACGTSFEYERHMLRRYAAGAGGAIIGGLSTQSIVGGAMIGGLAFALVTVLDEREGRRCPECANIVGEEKRRRKAARREQAAGIEEAEVQPSPQPH